MFDSTQSGNNNVAPFVLPIDLEAFRQSMKDQDLEDLVDELVVTFAKDAPVRLDALQTAIDSGDTDAIKSSAHAYKSAAVTMRAVRLASLLQETEIAAHEGDAGRPIDLLPQVKAEHEAVLMQLS